MGILSTRESNSRIKKSFADFVNLASQFKNHPEIIVPKEKIPTFKKYIQVTTTHNYDCKEELTSSLVVYETA